MSPGLKARVEESDALATHVRICTGPWVAKVPAATIGESVRCQPNSRQYHHMGLIRSRTASPQRRRWLDSSIAVSRMCPIQVARPDARPGMRNRRGSPASSGLKGRASQARKPHNCRMFRASAVEPSRGAALAADAYREWQFEAGAVRSRWRDPLACPGGRARSR